MNNVTKLAIVTALDKRLDSVKSALRADATADLAALWESAGVSQTKALINGQTVATVSISGVEPKAAIVDRPAFDAWCREVGFEVRTTYDYEGFGRLMANIHPEMLTEYTEFAESKAVLPKDFLDDLTKSDDVALYDGTIVEGVEWQQKPYGVRVTKVDTERVIGALAAGAINAGDMLALPEEA